VNRVFQAGTAKVDVTPPLTIPYLGFEPRHAFFEGVHDPLYARALAVDDGKTVAVLITADSIGFSNQILGPGRDFTAEVRQCVLAQTGIPAEHVMLASSHAHSTPETLNIRPLLDTPGAEAWLEVLMDQLASAAVMAVRNRKPSTLKVATGAVQGLGQSRRILGTDGKLYPWRNRPPDDNIADWGSTDPQVGVLSFDAIDGDSRILITNFACHAGRHRAGAAPRLSRLPWGGNGACGTDRASLQRQPVPARSVRRPGSSPGRFARFCRCDAVRDDARGRSDQTSGQAE